MKLNTVPLSPTRVHPIRTATWVQIDQPDGLRGALEICGQRTETSQKYKSQYYVRELYDHKGPERHFRLRKRPTGEEHYVCLVTDPDMHHACCCKGYEAGGRCKHLDALVELEQRGFLVVPQQNEEI